MTGLLRSPWSGWAVALLGGALWWTTAGDAATDTPDSRDEAGSSSDTGGAAPVLAVVSPTEQIALLGECRAKVRKLRDTRTAIECQPGVATKESRSDTPTAIAAAAGAGAVKPPDAEAERESNRRMLGAVVGASAAEADWLREYLCAVHDLRDATLDDLRAAGVTSENPDADATKQALVEARRQRELMLEDVKQRLGAERYSELRAVGGLSLIGSMLDCER